MNNLNNLNSLNNELQKLLNNDMLNYNNERERLHIYLTIIDVDIPEYLCKLIDDILISERIISINPIPYNNNNNIILYKGDITDLAVDAIVNAANSDMCGCYNPKHLCIDNIIHSKAGPRLRMECRKIMKTRKTFGIITPSYCLPCQYIIHVAGPIYNKHINQSDELAKCYTFSLDMAKNYNLKTIAFCCISTGLYGYPPELASKIAVNTVKNWLNKNSYNITVIFDTFISNDYRIYQDLLSID